VENPHGVGALGRNKAPYDALKRRSMIKINNETDFYCLPRALVVGEAYIALKQNETPEQKKTWKRVIAPRRVLQKTMAVSLCEQARVVVPDESCGIRELEKFQKFFKVKNIAIIAYNVRDLGNSVEHFFDGRLAFNHTQYEKIYLAYDHRQNHFDVISSLLGALNARYFCEYCQKKYSYVNKHRCSKKYLACFGSRSCNTSLEAIECGDCHR